MCHFMLFSIKAIEQFDLICNDITLKHSSYKKKLDVTVDNKLSFDEHINNICKTANKKLNALSNINHYMKQNQKELLPYFIISYFSYSPLIWISWSKKSPKKINAVYQRSRRIILNDYGPLYFILLEELCEITFHQWCIDTPMFEVCKYLNGHSPDTINDILNLRKNMYHLRNFLVFQTENPPSLKTRLDAIPYRASQLWQ